MVAVLDISADTFAETVVVCVTVVVVVWLIFRSRKSSDVNVQVHFPKDDKDDEEKK